MGLRPTYLAADLNGLQVTLGGSGEFDPDDQVGTQVVMTELERPGWEATGDAQLGQGQGLGPGAESREPGRSQQAAGSDRADRTGRRFGIRGHVGSTAGFGPRCLPWKPSPQSPWRRPWRQVFANST